MIRISNYVEIIPYKDQIILFQKINGNIVLIEKDKIIEKDNVVFVKSESKEELSTLKQLDFFVDDFAVQKYIRRCLSKQCLPMRTTVVLSVTEECNLKCAYCYQTNWKKQEKISPESYINLVINYIKKILPQIAKIEGTLNICFIGGEPLLQTKIIEEIIDAISVIAAYEENKAADIQFYIDTNATMLTREFIQKFPNLAVNTTLSLQRDHDKLRSNSFEKVLYSLKSVGDLFDNEKYKLFVRYNVHHGNIAEIEQFINMFNTYGIKYTLDIQNIMNSECTHYKNMLSDNEFQAQYIKEIVPILIKKSMEVNILPQYGLSRHCLCNGKFNRKIYSNGQVVLCDAFPKSDDDYKMEIEQLPEHCIKCFDFPYCGGPKPCKIMNCTGQYEGKENVRKKILCYVENFFSEE